jgi:hypothetical protein
MVIHRGRRTSEISLARRKSGVQIPSPPPHNSPGHRPGGSLPPGRCRSRSLCRAANGQQPRMKRPTAAQSRPRFACLSPGRRAVARADQDSKPRPSDYESQRTRPAGAVAAGSGCSGQRARLWSVVLTCWVTAGGMTKRMTRPAHSGTTGPSSTIRHSIGRLQLAETPTARSVGLSSTLIPASDGISR